MKDISTWGGEGEMYPEYGLSIGDIDIHRLTPEEFSKLACEMVTHLMLNGHRFKTVKYEMGVETFKEIE